MKEQKSSSALPALSFSPLFIHQHCASLRGSLSRGDASGFTELALSSSSSHLPFLGNHLTP